MNLQKKKVIIQNAPLWKRVIAYLIDVIIINVIIITQFKDKLINLNEENNFFRFQQYLLTNPNEMNYLVFILLSIMVLSIIYWAILEYKIKQSVGKLLMGIKVQSFSKTNSFWPFFIRNLSKPIAFIFIFDIIYMIFNPKNLRFFEILSKTQVVEELKI